MEQRRGLGKEGIFRAHPGHIARVRRLVVDVPRSERKERTSDHQEHHHDATPNRPPSTTHALENEKVLQWTLTYKHSLDPHGSDEHIPVMPDRSIYDR